MIFDAIVRGSAVRRALSPESPVSRICDRCLTGYSLGLICVHLSYNRQPRRHQPLADRLAHADLRHTQPSTAGFTKKTVTVATTRSERRGTYRIIEAIERFTTILGSRVCTAYSMV